VKGKGKKCGSVLVKALFRAGAISLNSSGTLEKDGRRERVNQETRARPVFPCKDRGARLDTPRRGYRELRGLVNKKRPQRS